MNNRPPAVPLIPEDAVPRRLDYHRSDEIIHRLLDPETDLNKEQNVIVINILVHQAMVEADMAWGGFGSLTLVSLRVLLESLRAFLAHPWRVGDFVHPMEEEYLGIQDLVLRDLVLMSELEKALACKKRGKGWVLVTVPTSEEDGHGEVQ